MTQPDRLDHNPDGLLPGSLFAPDPAYKQWAEQQGQAAREEPPPKFVHWQCKGQGRCVLEEYDPATMGVWPCTEGEEIPMPEPAVDALDLDVIERAALRVVAAMKAVYNAP